MCPDPPAPKPGRSAPPALDAVTLGETMMAFEATEYGPLRESPLFRKWIGGAEDNFAIGLARLGLGCGWISRLGRDEFGLEIIRTIRGEGVDVSRVVWDGQASTGVFFVESKTQGDPRCFYYRSGSAASRLGPEDMDPDYIGSARVAYATGITPGLSESALAAVERFFAIARERGLTIVFDPNLRLKLWERDQDLARAKLTRFMRRSDFVLAGEPELNWIMEAAEVKEAVAKAHQAGVGRLVVKRGSRGALRAFAGEPAAEFPAFAVKNPVSTMGAGDCFAAGFVAGLVKDKPVAEAITLGNAMGAFCLGHRGPYQGLPDYNELMDFVNGVASIAR